MYAAHARLLLCLQTTLKRAVPNIKLHACPAPVRSLISLTSCSMNNNRDMQKCFGHSGAAQATTSVGALDGNFGALSSAPTVPPPPALVIVISGPSGVGKDAVIRRLQEKRPDLYFVVTATSRPMRPGERDGVDYFFVTREEFESWIDNGRLLEHAVVYGEYKGIPRQQVEDALDRGTDVVLRIDVQGAATMRRLLPGLVSVFIVADNEAELVQRLVSRKTEPMDKMQIRVKTAQEELATIKDFDYVVVNRDGQLDDTVAQIEAILVAEKARVARRCGSGDGASVP